MYHPLISKKPIEHGGCILIGLIQLLIAVICLVVTPILQMKINDLKDQDRQLKEFEKEKNKQIREQLRQEKLEIRDKNKINTLELRKEQNLYKQLQSEKEKQFQNHVKRIVNNRTKLFNVEFYRYHPIFKTKHPENLLYIILRVKHNIDIPATQKHYYVCDNIKQINKIISQFEDSYNNDIF